MAEETDIHPPYNNIYEAVRALMTQENRNETLEQISIQFPDDLPHIWTLAHDMCCMKDIPILQHPMRLIYLNITDNLMSVIPYPREPVCQRCTEITSICKAFNVDDMMSEYLWQYFSYLHDPPNILCYPSSPMSARLTQWRDSYDMHATLKPAANKER